ncbi:hypothetical protein TNCV_3792231 [Trichonephila clavipes]|nr:hypothetical protein TNCV_3792231 [Trichonephila clavipes]
MSHSCKSNSKANRNMGDELSNFQPRINDEEDIELSSYSPNFNTTPQQCENLSRDRFDVHQLLYSVDLQWYQILLLRLTAHKFVTMTTRLPRPLSHRKSKSDRKHRS